MGYSVMQIEASNICSLTCVYCPHPSQVRPKGNMSMETFKKCIEVVKRSDNPKHKDRQFVWLNHFGEPLLNPLLPDFVSYAVSNGVEVSFSTNGVDYDKEFFPRHLWETLARCGLKSVEVSTHVQSEEAFRDHIGDIVRISWAWKPKKKYMHDWAGQVNISASKRADVKTPSQPCDYETYKMFAITWDGRIAACCYDIEAGSGLTVDDVLESGFAFREISLCSGCRLGRGDFKWIKNALPAMLG